MHFKILLTFLFLLVSFVYALAEEPVIGCSQFVYLEHLLEKLVRMEFKLEQLEKKHSDSNESAEQRHSDVQVAFTAVTTDHLTNLQDGQIVIFKQLVTNIGDAYKPSKGQFIAPLNGTYHFHTSFLSGKGTEVWVGIDLNGQVKVKAEARGTNDGHGTGSQSVILALKTGDIVSVKIIRGDAIAGSNYSSFSGFLLN